MRFNPIHLRAAQATPDLPALLDFSGLAPASPGLTECTRRTSSMLKLGYKLMSEEHGPADLVRNAQRAEQAGFDFAAISDHFFPWLEEQGHAPLAWSVLGALAHATRRMGLMTAVTCPIMRYHPAIIAQGAATVSAAEQQPVHAGTGRRRAPERARHRRRLARAGGASRALVGGARHHPGPASRHPDQLPGKALAARSCPPV